ncbi:hypothetical protein ACFX2J_037388 [Malus domestica]
MSLRPSTRTEVRLNNYKVAVDADEGRRRREDNMVEIWKNKGEESLLKKRREGFQAQQFAPYLQPSNLKKKRVYLPLRTHLQPIFLDLHPLRLLPLSFATPARSGRVENRVRLLVAIGAGVALEPVEAGIAQRAGEVGTTEKKTGEGR